MKKEYLSIKEYAEIRGSSTSAVYKRLDGSLQPYLEMVDGKKMLKIEVLKKEGLEPSTTPPPQPSTTPPQLSTDNGNERLIRALEERIEELKEEIHRIEEKAKEDTLFLKQQIEIKDRQIENQQILIDQQQKLNAISLTQEEKILTEPTAESNIETTKESIFSRFKKLF